MENLKINYEAGLCSAAQTFSTAEAMTEVDWSMKNPVAVASFTFNWKFMQNFTSHFVTDSLEPL